MTSLFLMLFLALLLDALLGEPDWLWSRVPHPVTLMGRLIDLVDTRFNTGTARRVKGIVVILSLSLLALFIGWIIMLIPDFGLLEVIGAAILLAHRSLIEHVRDVATALRENLQAGRDAVSMIVGRDTGGMDQGDVARAAVESAAENFSDGVIAPAFWFLLLGLPGILLYKMVNTADSMIGYLSDDYAEFGYGAAKLDDLLNWVPARLCALLICLANRRPQALRIVLADADLHRSPNAGWPEAAVAGTLDIALSGPRSYGGQIEDHPFVNADGRQALDSYDIDNVTRVLNRTWIAVMVMSLIIGALSLVF